MYQAGEVDYLVATDAIGMGLNLDITHVAFSGLTKFDGHRMRMLQPDELAQIAGRAGRHMTQGTFGVTGEAHPPEDEVVQAIENHQFRPVTRLMWRNSRLQFGSVKRLLQGLEERTDNDWLTRVRESDDLAALRALGEDAVLAARASDGPSVRLLWDVCRIPDFRGISRGEHAGLLHEIFVFLHQHGHIPQDWFATHLARIDKTDGDIDTLSKRLAFVRTWTYVAQRRGWLADESRWREETRAIEDRLSDALHTALTQRFVDRRTSVLLRRLKQKESLVAEVNDKGEVTVDGEFVGRLEGFRFRMDKTASPDEARTLRQACLVALAPHFALRADRFYNAPDPEMDFTEQGGLMWGDQALGKLVSGADPMKPQVAAFVDEDAGPDVAQKVQRRLQHFIDRKIAAAFEPLLALQRDEALTGLARGFAYRLVENFGIIPRGDIADDVKALDQEARGALRKHGIRFGQFTIFLPALLKPAPTRLRLVLWSLAQGLSEFPEAPPAGLVTVPTVPGVVPGVFAMSGYRAAGERAIRIDRLARLADMLRLKDSKAGFECNPEMLSISGLSLDQFAQMMEGLGYKATRGERPKLRLRPVAAGDMPQEIPDAPAEMPTPTPAEMPVDVPVELPDAPAEMPESTPQEAPFDDPQMAADRPEMETFYVFTWVGRGPRRDHRGENRGAARAERPAGEGRRDNRRRGGPRSDAPAAPVADAPIAGAAPAEAAPAEPRGDGRRGENRRPENHRPESHRPEKRGEKRGESRNGARADKAGERGAEPRPDRFKDKSRYKPDPRDDRKIEARPPREERREKPIDPDNPFAAALAGFKVK